MEYVFSFETGYQHHNGFGFISRQFEEIEERDRWNDGRNHCLVYYGNGYCVRSEEFDLLSDGKSRFWKTQWYDQKEIVNVKIHTNRMEALLWNKSKMKKDNLEFDECDPYNLSQHLIRLPKHKEIALIVVVGCTPQTFTNLSQHFNSSEIT